MFSGVTRLVLAAPRRVLFLALSFMILAAVFGAPVVTSLSSGGFEDPGAQSTRVDEMLTTELDRGHMPMIFMVESPLPVDADGSARAAIDQLVVRLRSDPGVKTVVSPWDTADPVESGLVARDRLSGIVTVWLSGDENAATAHARSLAKTLAGERPGGVSILVGGEGGAVAQMTEQMMSDLAISEAIALPICLLVLVWVFGGLVASLIPMAIGGLAIAGNVAVLRLVSQFTEVSMFALNIATAIGFALAVDYSLLMVSRYREERSRGRSAEAAIIHTVHSAGHTVMFSALTVGLSVVATVFFPIPALRSFAYSGAAVVTFAAIAAILVVPAAILVFGDRIEAGTPRRSKMFALRRFAPGGIDSFWYRWAKRVMRRPVLFAVIATVPLIVAGVPFLDIRFGSPDDRALPTSSEAKIVADEMRRGYTQDLTNTIPVVVLAGAGTPVGAIRDYCAQLSAVDGVVEVTTPQMTCSSGVAMDSAVRMQAPSHLKALSVTSNTSPNSPMGSAMLDAMHRLDVPPGSEVLFGGTEQRNRDSVEAVTEKIPVVLGWVAITSFILLFLLTGSLVIPLKALFLNLLSLSATFGALVWVFQQGHLGGLGTTAWGGVMVTTPVLIFCVLFGLSMDYEVFLISRIREFWLRSPGSRAANTEAVALGLSSTASVVTAAALIMAITFVGVAASQVAQLRMFGVGTTLAILLDATLIRMVLLPAFMAMLGKWNWWPDNRLRSRSARHRRAIGTAPQDWLIRRSFPTSNQSRAGAADVPTAAS